MEASKFGGVAERRRHPRRQIDRACKVYHPVTRRYISAHACDVSEGGAMLTLESSRSLAVGDRIELVIAWDWVPVLAATAMMPARVVRVAPLEGGRQAIAVAFEEVAMMAA